MITSIFINALGQAIFESCGQALLIYVVLQLLMQLFPAVSSKYKYDMNYLGLIIITCWFLGNLVKIYFHDEEMSKFSVYLLNSPAVHGSQHLPTLLQQTEAFITTYAKYITGLYMIGLLLQGFKLMGGFVHIHHIRKQKNLSADRFWSNKAEQLSAQLKVVKKVALYFSVQVDVPLTIGYFKPIIIFPIALINNLDTEQTEAILMHELAHIKRHDYLLNILQCVMETLLCFNPFVWLISKTIRQEREYCCDDLVMDADYNNFTYSKALFLIAQQNNQNYALAMASAGKNKYPLLNRIKRLNTMNTNESLPKFHLLVIVTVAAIAGLLAWGIPQYSQAKATHHTNRKLVRNLHSAIPTTPITVTAILSARAQAVSPSAISGISLNGDTTGNKSVTDSIVSHSKAKFKIVMEDDKGNKKEYNSVQDLPDSEKSEFLKENPSFGNFDFKFNDSLKFKDFKIDGKFQNQILAMKLDAEKIRREYKNDPRWKTMDPHFEKQVLAMKIDAEKMRKQFDSPEWKKQMEDMKLQAEKMNTEASNPEFKKQVEDMKIQAQKMADDYSNNPVFKKQVMEIKIQAEKISKQANSRKFKKQIKEMQIQALKINEQFNSPEWKKQMEDMQIKIKDEVGEKIKAAQDSVKTSN